MPGSQCRSYDPDERQLRARVVSGWDRATSMSEWCPACPRRRQEWASCKKVYPDIPFRPACGRWAAAFGASGAGVDRSAADAGS